MWKNQPAWLAYVAPMVVFLAMTQLESFAVTPDGQTNPAIYPWLYGLKIVATVITVWIFRSAWADFRPCGSWISLIVAVVMGILVTTVWIGLDGRYPGIPFLSGGRAAFDPNTLSPAMKIGFLATRLFGLVLVVPLIEELFWRSFLVRWIIDPEFKTVPIGKMTWKAAVISSIAFALVHPEWLPAILTGLAWAWLLMWSKSLTTCFISHAVANLVLGAYVLITHEWKYW